MSQSTSFIVCLVLVSIAASRLAGARSNLEESCRELKDELRTFLGKEPDSVKAFEYGKNYLTANFKPFTKERRLIRAWSSILKGEDCSSSSWEHLLLMGVCNPGKLMGDLEEPIKVYANKCLTNKLVASKIKSGTTGLLIPRLGFIGSTFIAKFHELNPNGKSLFLDHCDMNKCCIVCNSIGSLNYVIEQDLLKKKKDPAKTFYANKGALKSYLYKNLFNSCDRYSVAARWVMSQLNVVARYYEGGDAALITTLDQESQEAIFKYKFCRELAYWRDEVLLRVSKKFV